MKLDKTTISLAKKSNNLALCALYVLNEFEGTPSADCSQIADLRKALNGYRKAEGEFLNAHSSRGAS